MTEGRAQDEPWRSFICSSFVCTDSDRGRDILPLLAKRPPVGPNERLAFPHPNSLKRAALLVDRIYLPSWTSPDRLDEVPIELTFGDPLSDQQTVNESATYAEVDWPWKIDDPQRKEQEFLDIFLRQPLVKYRTRFPHASIVPINYDAGSAVLPAGAHDAYQGVLNNVPVVIEESLSWRQVLDFRKDPEARRQFRDLHVWMDGLAAPSEQQATDLIAQKLDDYRWATKKHGLSTWVQAISAFVSLGAVIPSAGGLAAQAVLLNPVWGVAAGGALAVAGATAWVAKRMLGLEDMKRGAHREVAYLYHLQRLGDGTAALQSAP